MVNKQFCSLETVCRYDLVHDGKAVKLPPLCRMHTFA